MRTLHKDEDDDDLRNYSFGKGQFGRPLPKREEQEVSPQEQQVEMSVMKNAEENHGMLLNGETVQDYNLDEEEVRVTEFNRVHTNLNLKELVNEPVKKEEEAKKREPKSTLIKVELRERNKLLNVFDHQQFNQLGLNTMTELFQKMERKFNLTEYMEVVWKSQLENRYSDYLADNGQNELTLRTHPVFDMGDIPDTYIKDKLEAEQAFVTPKSSYPNRIIFRYCDFRPRFNDKHIQRKY